MLWKHMGKSWERLFRVVASEIDIELRFKLEEKKVNSPWIEEGA